MAHVETDNLAQQVTSTLNRADDLAFLTDANVAAADTRAGLVAAIEAVVVHNDLENIKALLKRVIYLDSNITDDAIASLTTVAGLIALTGFTTSSTAILE